MTSRPPPTKGLRHVALFVAAFEETERFYTELMGMAVEWRPDADNVYLTSGNDNLALHRVAEMPEPGQLDHVGFFVGEPEQVDDWYQFLKEREVRMLTEPRTHRDGARSFYCQDPAGVRVQVLHHPPISNQEPSGT